LSQTHTSQPGQHLRGMTRLAQLPPQDHGAAVCVAGFLQVRQTCESVPEEGQGRCLPSTVSLIGRHLQCPFSVYSGHLIIANMMRQQPEPDQCDRHTMVITDLATVGQIALPLGLGSAVSAQGMVDKGWDHVSEDLVPPVTYLAKHSHDLRVVFSGGVVVALVYGKECQHVMH
jgi:hypothetical protein